MMIYAVIYVFVTKVN